MALHCSACSLHAFALLCWGFARLCIALCALCMLSFCSACSLHCSLWALHGAVHPLHACLQRCIALLGSLHDFPLLWVLFACSVFALHALCTLPLGFALLCMLLAWLCIALCALCTLRFCSAHSLHAPPACCRLCNPCTVLSMLPASFAVLAHALHIASFSGAPQTPPPSPSKT